MLPTVVALLLLLGSSIAQTPAHLLLQNPIGQWPEYKRGKGEYKWVLSKRAREMGLTYTGPNDRLRVVMDRLKQGQQIKIATVGGSITAGQGCIDAPSWPQYVFNFMEDELGKDKVQGQNGAVGGTLSAYMSVCHNMHIPRDSDIIFVEYGVNDPATPSPPFQNNPRRSYERLLRKLLRYPKRPAVILMHQYMWFHASPFLGSFYSNAEREFQEFAIYYGLPTISTKACCHQLMANNTPGFDVRDQRTNKEKALRDIAYYWDPVHPDGRTGARVSAELAMYLLQRTYNDLKKNPVTDDDRAVVAASLPLPMIPNNFESASDKCFIGNQFVSIVSEKKGFEWINESKGQRPKWGFVATEVGSVLKMLIDTRASAGQQASSDTKVLVELAYLRSYEHMGQAKVTCEGDCTCDPTTMEGHTTDLNSQLHLHNFYATQGEKCNVVVTVAAATKSKEHKVKVAGVMISEETGQSDGIRNHAAVEYVHDISARSKDNTFNLINHAR